MQRFERPQSLEGFTHKARTAHGNLYVTVSLSDAKVVEVFAKLGKAGGCDSAYLEAITRMASIALQYGVPLDAVERQLRSVTCHPFMVGSDMENTSPVDAIGHILSDYIEESNE